MGNNQENFEQNFSRGEFKVGMAESSSKPLDYDRIMEVRIMCDSGIVYDCSCRSGTPH